MKWRLWLLFIKLAFRWHPATTKLVVRFGRYEVGSDWSLYRRDGQIGRPIIRGRIHPTTKAWLREHGYL